MHVILLHRVSFDREYRKLNYSSVHTRHLAQGLHSFSFNIRAKYSSLLKGVKTNECVTHMCLVLYSTIELSRNLHKF